MRFDWRPDRTIIFRTGLIWHVKPLERFKKYCSHSAKGIRERSFWVFASFRLSHRPLRACSFAKASPKPKNPRSEWPHYFLKRSSPTHFSIRVGTLAGYVRQCLVHCHPDEFENDLSPNLGTRGRRSDGRFCSAVPGGQ